MLVRVKLIGDGTKANPYRVPLPTYQEVLSLPEQGLAWVSVSETEHPELAKHSSAKVEKTGFGDALIGLDAAGHEEWYAHIDERYQEHKGKFRPEIA